jgi:hypothetical protein
MKLVAAPAHSRLWHFCDQSMSQREFGYRGISGHTLEDIGEPLFDHLVGAATIPSHSGKPALRRPSSYLA